VGYLVVISPQAEADLGAIVAFIAQDSPSNAIRIGDELVDMALSIDELPYRGASVRLRPNTRRLIHLHYLILYRIVEPARCVEILRFWDGRQDPANLTLR
jgi:plasmid stabilization system protein ParE